MKKIEGHNSAELFEGTIQALNTIREFVEKNNKYQIKGEFNSLFKITKEQIMDLGICDRRRLTRAINKVNFKQSLVSFNKFLWFINKIVLNKTEAVRVTEPQHERIQEFKRKWKEAQAIADNLHEQYKSEKGNYYK